jgi:hypothetical protein
MSVSAMGSLLEGAQHPRPRGPRVDPAQVAWPLATTAVVREHSAMRFASRSHRPALGALTSILALTLLGGCASLRAPACPAGQSRATLAQLMFGRAMADGGQVSEADWRAFLDEEVTPRFPDGLTVVDAGGQWRSRAGVIGKEPSKVLMLVLPGGRDEAARIEAVREAYKARFRQESVLLITQPVCAAF